VTTAEAAPDLLEATPSVEVPPEPLAPPSVAPLATLADVVIAPTAPLGGEDRPLSLGQALGRLCPTTVQG
jgi:hypothetical protein